MFFLGEIFIRLVELPCKVKALTSLDSEGDYNILINNKMNFEMQREAYLHELAHVLHKDFDIINNTESLE